MLECLTRHVEVHNSAAAGGAASRKRGASAAGSQARCHRSQCATHPIRRGARAARAGSGATFNIAPPLSIVTRESSWSCPKHHLYRPRHGFKLYLTHHIATRSRPRSANDDLYFPFQHERALPPASFILFGVAPTAFWAIVVLFQMLLLTACYLLLRFASVSDHGLSIGHATRLALATTGLGVTDNLQCALGDVRCLVVIGVMSFLQVCPGTPGEPYFSLSRPLFSPSRTPSRTPLRDARPVVDTKPAMPSHRPTSLFNTDHARVTRAALCRPRRPPSCLEFVFLTVVGSIVLVRVFRRNTRGRFHFARNAVIRRGEFCARVISDRPSVLLQARDDTVVSSRRVVSDSRDDDANATMRVARAEQRVGAVRRNLR